MPASHSHEQHWHDLHAAMGRCRSEHCCLVYCVLGTTAPHSCMQVMPMLFMTRSVSALLLPACSALAAVQMQVSQSMLLLLFSALWSSS